MKLSQITLFQVDQGPKQIYIDCIHLYLASLFDFEQQRCSLQNYKYDVTG